MEGLPHGVVKSGMFGSPLDTHRERMKMHDENEKNPTQETSCDDPPGEKTSGDTDVLSLIEDVERHLLRIRTAQSKQAGEFNEIANRMQAAEQAEQELARHMTQARCMRPA